MSDKQKDVPKTLNLNHLIDFKKQDSTTNKKEEKTKQPIDSTITILICCVIIGIIMVFSKKTSGSTESTFTNQSSGQIVSKTQGSNEEPNYYEEVEKKLEDMLTQLAGAGMSKVMITEASSNERVVIQETKETSKETNEVDKTGRTKTNVEKQLEEEVVMENGKNPFVTKIKRGEIAGVMVLAQGGGDEAIRKTIQFAVASALGIEQKKVAVFQLDVN